MTSESTSWNSKLVKDVIELRYGKGLKEGERRNGPYTVYGSNGIIGYHDQYLVEGPGIIIGRKGSVGTVSFSRENFWPIDTTYYIIFKNTEDYTFWFYFLKTLNLYQMNTHSAVPGLNRENVYNLRIEIPSYPEQKAISKILSDLDSKIELNQQMNKTLESIAQAIFKHWFIDFEFPDENGQPYKSSGGEMVDSELGEIPKGWEVLTLEDYGTFKNGINYLRDESGDTTFFIANVRNIANNRLLLKTSLDQINVNLNKAKEYFLRDKDILIARSASPGEVCLVLGDLENVIYSGFSIRYRLNNPSGYLYIFLIMQKLKKRLSNYSVGTTLQSINQETLKKLMFILPSSGVLSRFNMIGEQLLKKTYNNMVQNYGLSQIRDLLLPKLMSGKIRVPLEE